MGQAPALIRALVLSLCLVTAARAGAEPCPLPAGADPALAALATEARLGAVAGGLEAAARPAATWNWGWGLGFAAVGAAQLAAAPLFDDRGRRIDLYVGGIQSLVAALSVVVLPLETPARARELRAVISSGAGRPADCAVLARAEGLLASAAAGERLGKGWLKHALGIGFNAGVALILGLGYQRWPSAGLSFVSGVLVGELMIFTQPTRSVGAWSRYLAGQVGPAAPPVAWAVFPTLDGHGFTAQLAITF